MALLISRKSLARLPGQIAPDLAAATKAAGEAQQLSIDGSQLGAAHYRKWFDEYVQVVSPPEVRAQCEVRDITLPTEVGQLGARLYRPDSEESVVVFVHGGGWIMGSVETHDHECRWLAIASKSRVISLEYGLAPEHPFPYAIDQVSAALSLLLKHSEYHRALPVFVAGDSAGANIAAMAILRLSRSERERITGFVSIYGAYSPLMNLSSHKLFGDGAFGLSKQQMSFFWNLYAPQIEASERHQITPLGMDIDHFPSTLCIGVEYDLLLDDSLAFYSALASTGTDVTLSLWPGLTHGALHFVGLVDSVTEAAQSIVQYIAARRSPAGESTLLHSIGRMLTRTENHEPLQLPMLDDRQKSMLGLGVSVATPNLLPRSRQHGSVIHALGNEIVRGAYAPGEVIPDASDGELNLSVSRNAYREAIRTLAAKGLVIATPRVGTRVASRAAWRLLDPDVLAWRFESSLDESFLRDLFEFRKVIEPSAAALAAVRMPPELKADLANAVSQMTRADVYSPEWSMPMLRFHQLILQGGNNELVETLWPSFQVVLQWLANLGATGLGHGNDRDPVGDYAMVYDRIASRDAEGAMLETAYLIDASLASAIKFLGALQPVSPESAIYTSAWQRDPSE